VSCAIAPTRKRASAPVAQRTSGNDQAADLRAELATVPTAGRVVVAGDVTRSTVPA
jgi:hypothetical protein